MNKNKTKIRIAIEDVEYLLGMVREINSHDIEDIDWTYRGKKKKFAKKILEEFRKTGLGNTCFVQTKFWKRRK